MRRLMKVWRTRMGIGEVNAYGTNNYTHLLPNVKGLAAGGTDCPEMGRPGCDVRPLARIYAGIGLGSPAVIR